MQKTGRKKLYRCEVIEEEMDDKEEKKLKKNITKLMKENNLRKMRRIVNRQGEDSWGYNIKARVCIVLVISG